MSFLLYILDLHDLMPFITPGVTSIKDSEQQISELESLLDSQVVCSMLLEGSIDPGQDTWWLTDAIFMQIYATENQAELEEFVPSAKEVRRFYDRPVLNLQLEALRAEIDLSRKKVIKSACFAHN